MPSETQGQSFSAEHPLPAREPAQPQRPRRGWSSRPPSDRDWEVFKQVKIHLIPQWQVAAALEVHSSRVSQIVKRVTCWIAAGGKVTDPQILAYLARRQVAREIHRQRLLRIIELASRALESPPEKLRTIRRRFVGGREVSRRETVREQPATCLPAIAILRKAMETLEEFDRREKLAKLQEQAATPAPSPANMSTGQIVMHAASPSATGTCDMHADPK